MNLKAKTILVIDDNPEIVFIIQLALERTMIWQVLSATSPQMGINIAQEKQPDVILLDVMMPDTDGLQVTKTLRSKSETQHIPIILVTAKANITRYEDLAEYDIAGVITKPFEVEQLGSQIQELLGWTS